MCANLPYTIFMVSFKWGNGGNSDTVETAVAAVLLAICSKQPHGLYDSAE